MTTMERLQEVFRDVFDDEEMKIYESMTAQDVEDWDSLMHIQLIVAVENEFGVKFTTNEVVGLKNVGEFLRCLEEKLNK